MEEINPFLTHVGVSQNTKEPKTKLAAVDVKQIQSV